MTRRVAVLMFDNVEVMDFAGPFEVFGVSGRREGKNLFDVYPAAERVSHHDPAAPAPTAGGPSVVVPIGRSAAGGDRPEAGARVDDQVLVHVLQTAVERGASTVYMVAQSK